MLLRPDGEAVIGAEFGPLFTIRRLASWLTADGVPLDGIFGALRVMGGGRLFPAGATAAPTAGAGAGRVAAGSDWTGPGDGGVSATASWRAFTLKLRFLRIGVAMIGSGRNVLTVEIACYENQGTD